MERRKAKREEKRKPIADECDRLEQVADPVNLFYSARQSRKGVGFKSSVQKYCVNIFRNIFASRRDILSGKDVREGFIEFDIAERGKNRHIRAMKFRERVIQRCLCSFVLVPMLLRSLVYDNGASQTGKGIHFALYRCCHHVKQFYKRYGKDGYILLIDFSGYFDNIEHAHIREIIDKEFRDKRLKRLIWRFVTAFGSKSLGIGSQVSQIFAVVYTNCVDHYAREVLRLGLSARYMDDSYFMHPDKEYLQKALEEMKIRFEKLGIKVNPNKTCIMSTRAFTFLKVRYRRLDSGKVLMLPNKKAFTRMRHKMRKLKQKVDAGEVKMDAVRTSYQSFFGYYGHLDCKRSLRRMDRLYFDLYGEKPVHKRKKRRRKYHR